MGRKSLKTERVEAILDAFERCVEAKGLQSTTLDNIAEEAGMARRMVRHYVGNREDLIRAGVDRIIAKFEASIGEIIDNSGSEERFTRGLDYIFSEAFNSLPATKLVAALLPVSLYDPEVQKAIKSIYDFFQENLELELRKHIPQAQSEQVKQCAYSVMCLSFGGGWMRNIGFDPALNQRNKRLAEQLISELMTAHSNT